MIEYKGFKYTQCPDGSWNVYVPGGGKIKAPKQSEEALKHEIDELEKNRS